MTTPTPTPPPGPAVAPNLEAAVAGVRGLCTYPPRGTVASVAAASGYTEDQIKLLLTLTPPALDLDEDVLADADTVAAAAVNLIWKYHVWVSNNNDEAATFTADVQRIVDRFGGTPRTPEANR